MTVSRKSKIYFFFEKPMKLVNRSKLKKFLESLFEREGKKLQYVNYIFCSDDYLRSINRSYLKHDYFTDIVTFQLSDGRRPIEGEVYISVERVTENAVAYGQSRIREVHRVIIHGALHLCGYRDKTRVEKIEMTGKEDQYLALYF